MKKQKEITSLEEVLFVRKIGIQEIVNVQFIIESVTRAEYASDIAEIVLNLTVESIMD